MSLRIRCSSRRLGNSVSSILPQLTLQRLEAHLKGAANILRGKTAGQDYKNYILSLMFYKRLCDQWEHEADEAIAQLERQQRRPFTEKQRAVFRARGEHRFLVPDGSRWGDVLAVAEDIGKKLTDAMRAVAGANDELRGVFTVDWNQPALDASGKKLIPNEVVHALVQHFHEIDLSNRSVPSDVLGRACEYLINLCSSPTTPGPRRASSSRRPRSWTRSCASWISTNCSRGGDAMKKKVEKLTPEAKRARRKLKASTGRKAYYSLDTEFGVLTVEDAPAKTTAPRTKSNGKPKR
jgi:HsdM N-terminal domain